VEKNQFDNQPRFTWVKTTSAVQNFIGNFCKRSKFAENFIQLPQYQTFFLRTELSISLAVKKTELD